MALVILDRVGVINFDSKDYIKSPDEWRPIPGSLEAIARLCRANFQVVLATNQSGIGRGLFDVDTLNRIHQISCGVNTYRAYFCVLGSLSNFSICADVNWKSNTFKFSSILEG